MWQPGHSSQKPLNPLHHRQRDRLGRLDALVADERKVWRRARSERGELTCAQTGQVKGRAVDFGGDGGADLKIQRLPDVYTSSLDLKPGWQVCDLEAGRGRSKARGL